MVLVGARSGLVVGAVIGGSGRVARRARAACFAGGGTGTWEVVGGRRSSNSSSLMGDEGWTGVVEGGRAKVGKAEEKRVERAVEEDMER